MTITMPTATQTVPPQAPTPQPCEPARLRNVLEVGGPTGPRYAEILTPEALDFVARLHCMFAARRCELLAARRERYARVAAGEDFHFLPETQAIRDDPSWRVAPPAPGLADRRVEITGPTDRKMAINALNSGASVWLADFEDANAPTWQNIVEGQLNLLDAVQGRLTLSTPEKEYRLTEGPRPTIVVRPRGWHLPEKHVWLNGAPLSASLVDFGLYFFHCAQRQIEAGSGPYFYLPKLESHLEARLWNDVFCFAQDELAIPRGTVRATVLIETLPVAFEMEEILYELREHVAGLNAGRWDYIFSTIKCLRERGERYVLPDRSEITMTVPFMRAYTELLVRTCHKRGAHAIGGMAAAVPDRQRPEVTERALAKVRADKEREAGDGFDGSWVAHPELVAVCREVFDAALRDRPDQRHRLREDVNVTASDLLAVDQTPGRITATGLRNNVSVALRYLEAWLGGRGAVAIDGLMEDAATAEISRCQLWQWIRYRSRLAEGPIVTRKLVADILDEECRRIEASLGEDAEASRRLRQARDLLGEVALGDELPDFLTLPAYVRHLVRRAAT